MVILFHVSHALLIVFRTSAPLSIRLCGSCIVALLPAGRLEIFTIAHSILVQTLSLGVDCIVSSRSFANAGFCLADQNHIYIARQMSSDDQVAYLVQALNAELAEAVLKATDASPEMLNALNLRLGKAFIRHLLFQVVSHSIWQSF